MTSLGGPSPPGDGAGLPLGDGVWGGDSCSVEVEGFPASAADVSSLAGLGLPDARPPGDARRSRAGDADGTEAGLGVSRLDAGERSARPGRRAALGVGHGGGGGVGFWCEGMDDVSSGERRSG